MSALLAALFLAGIATASPLPPEGIFVFSDLCREEESDDIAGYRLILARHGAALRADFAWSEGPLAEGKTDQVRFDARTGRIDFTVAQDGDPANLQHVRGIVDAGHFRLERPGAALLPRLPYARRNRIPACRAP